MFDKLAVVLLPIALAAGWLAVLALRGRMPSRAVLNVWFSLLLMLYLLATAALGIFWVANQHLPVFDWHYVFGYAMLVLLVVHLGFNFRIVWRHFARRGAAVQAPAGAVAARAAARRPLVGALGFFGVAAASGLAYLLGLRHGRTELRVVAGVEGAGNVALAVVEQFHAFSSHSRAGLLRRAASVDWGGPPAPFKSFPGQRTLALPPPAAAAGGAGSALDIGALGTLLWHTVGVNQTRGGILFRTAPSSGALFATELYLALDGAAGLPRGAWNYHGGTHRLQAVHDHDPAALLPPGAIAAFWFTALFRRSGHKYGDRTYRYVLADLGHALENLRVAADALGLRLLLESGFDEASAAQALAIDQAEEGVLALALIVPRDGPPRPRSSAPVPETQGRWAAAAVNPGASAALGVTDAIHRATSLRAATAAGPGRRMTAIRPEPLAVKRLPLAPPTGEDPLRTIASRRSVRRFAGDAALTQEQLAAALAAMTSAPAQLSAAVRIDVVTQAVAGLEAAAWRYDAAERALQLQVRHDAADVRRRSRAAALDQDVIGDAAAVIVLSIDRAAFADDPAGPARGYRHAFIEAGLFGERLYLEAGARGLGVCAVGAFYDDEAAALVGADPRHGWIVHLAALGVPAR
jgi:SagB-type dehydrogenase family enzyme